MNFFVFFGKKLDNDLLDVVQHPARQQVHLVDINGGCQIDLAVLLRVDGVLRFNQR
jgi:hypothetical protein